MPTLFDLMNTLSNRADPTPTERALRTMLDEAKNITELLRSVTLSYAEKAEALGGIVALLSCYPAEHALVLRKLITLLYFAWVRSSQYPFPSSLLPALLSEAEMVVVTDLELSYPTPNETPVGDNA